MSKRKMTNQIDHKNLEKEIMSKVTTGQISMKPRWYFVIGAILSIAGFTAFSISAIFFTNVMLFLLRQHGPMGYIRLSNILESFSWWIPVVAVLGTVGGIFLLRRYDFSYKKNFLVIAIGFIATVIIAGIVMDRLGVNEVWSKKEIMRQFYKNAEGRRSTMRGRGLFMQNGNYNY